MSSSSNGAVGITKAYIRDASDVTRRLQRQKTYQEFTGTGAPAYPWNYGNEQYLTFLFGKKECDSGCTGQPFQFRTVRLFR